MARLKIDIPNNILFSTEYLVTISDINYGNHLGNDRLLLIAQEARIRFFRSHGMKDELSIGENVGIIIADASISYKSESFLGDVLTVLISVSDLGRVGFDMFYRVSCSNKIVAEIRTGIVFFDYSKRKVVEIPETMRQLLSD